MHDGFRKIGKEQYHSVALVLKYKMAAYQNL